VDARERKRTERQRRRAARLQWSPRLSLASRVARFMNTFAALIVFLALWFLYFTGREGLSAEPPAVGIEGPVG